MSKLLYSRKEAAVSLSMSIRTLDKYIAAGKLKVRRMHGRVMLTVAELQKFISQDQQLVTVFKLSETKTLWGHYEDAP